MLLLLYDEGAGSVPYCLIVIGYGNLGAVTLPNATKLFSTWFPLIQHGSR